MASEPELRDTSDRVLEQLTRLAELETAKRRATPGTAAFVELRVGPRVERTTKTDSAGAFRFENVQEGIYDIRVARAGFLDVVRRVTLASSGVPPRG